MRAQPWMLASATVVLAVTAFTCREIESPVLERDVERAREWSLAPGAKLVSRSRPSRGQSSFEVSWEIESNHSWPSYRAALERAMPAGYAAGPASERSASFRKTLAGDTYHLRAEILAGGPPLRIRVTFVAQAS